MLAKKRTFKRLKNIEGKNEQQMDLIEDQGEKQLNLINKSNLENRSEKLQIEDVLNEKARKISNKINKEIRDNENKKFLCTHSNGKEYNFYNFANLNRFGSKIFNGEILIEDALEEQARMKNLLMSLKKYDPSNDNKIKARKEVLKNAEDLFETRNKIINAFIDSTFPVVKNVQKTN